MVPSNLGRRGSSRVSGAWPSNFGQFLSAISERLDGVVRKGQFSRETVTRLFVFLNFILGGAGYYFFSFFFTSKQRFGSSAGEKIDTSIATRLFKA